MESVYFYEEKISKDITKILKDDEFMRISYIIRDSKTLLSERKGYIIYIQASQDEMNSIEQKLKDLGAEELTGEEKAIIDAIKAEEENAATGIGMIFG